MYSRRTASLFTAKQDWKKDGSCNLFCLNCQKLKEKLHQNSRKIVIEIMKSQRANILGYKFAQIWCGRQRWRLMKIIWIQRPNNAIPHMRMILSLTIFHDESAKMMRIGRWNSTSPYWLLQQLPGSEIVLIFRKEHDKVQKRQSWLWQVCGC